METKNSPELSEINATKKVWETPKVLATFSEQEVLQQDQAVAYLGLGPVV